MYVIDINTHVLLFFYYYIVKQFSQFLTNICLKKLVDYLCIWRSVIIFQLEDKIYQKVSGMSW